MQKPTEKEVDEFLYQSNLIEGIDDPRMLADAIDAWTWLMKQEKLDSKVILTTHKILMRNSGLYPNERGYFRTCEVTVGGRSGLKHTLVPKAIEGWCAMANVFTHDWKNMHVAYEQIHPFVDGNGRTGRMFMNWQRLKFGVPLLTINADARGEYYKWFND